MKVVYVPVGKEPEIKEIDGTLDGMDSNRLIFGGRDFIAGDFFVVAVRPNEDGDMDIIGLNDRQEEFVMKTIGFGRFYKE